GIGVSSLAAADDDESIIEPVQSEHGAECFCPSRTDESSDAENFALAQREADGARFGSACESFHFEYRRADAMRLARIDVADFAADHQSNNFRQGDGRGVSSSDAFTVAQHRVALA